MTSSRDLRAMVAGLERAMQCLRSAKGSKIVEEIKKARAALENEVADAKAMQRLATRSGTDNSRLSEKIIAAGTLLKKCESSSGDVVVEIEKSVVGGMSDLATRSNALDSAVSHPENINSQYLRAPRDVDDRSEAPSLRATMKNCVFELRKFPYEEGWKILKGRKWTSKGRNRI